MRPPTDAWRAVAVQDRVVSRQSRVSAFAPRLAALAVALSVLSALAASPPARAQMAEASGGRPTVFDLRLGEPWTAQPVDFQEFACGTNGGPPSTRLAGFHDFATCAAEETGLHEVQFRYDDERYHLALARNDLARADFFAGTRFGNFDVLVAGLFDAAGILRGLRITTDDRVSSGARQLAYSMVAFVRTIYGEDGWICVDLPVGAGEEPVGNLLVKQDCERTADGLGVFTQSRLLRRPGQLLVDPRNGQLRDGLFESTARVEVYEINGDGELVLSDPDASPAEAQLADDALDDARAAFLAGASIDCPGCDLQGVSLKRRNLSGADLSGADLTGASLHRAVLAGADLADANLTAANLNLADFRRASLPGAKLSGAYLFLADFGGADLSGSELDGTRARDARFTQATMTGAIWRNSDATGVNAAGANLTNADLSGTFFGDGDMQRAILTRATLTDASFFGTRLIAADLSGALAVNADFLEADLTDARLTGADLSDARLTRARMRGADLTDALLTGATMPDGSVVR
ncbi:MAG: pentapeptide repeat-containing protein [Bauldia sp.]|nr:pentapeptide repeat-containing protein [Bauldia sp.]